MTCRRGHDLSIHGRREGKQWRCRVCKQARDRAQRARKPKGKPLSHYL